MPRKKKNGVGATCSVLIRFLHPRMQIVTQFPNAKYVDRLEGLVSQSREIKKVNHRDQTVIVFRHDDFPNELVYCNERYAKVVECGAQCDYFRTESEEVGGWQAAEEIVVEATIDNSNDTDLLVVPVLNENQDIREKIVRLISEGYEVDDDNQPAPENIPDTQRRTMLTEEGISWFPWGSRSTCQRQSQGHRFENPRLVNPPVTSRCIDYFIHFLPPFIKDIILVETNKQINGKDVTWGEFVTYLGLWFLLSTVSHGCPRRAFWEDREPSEWSGAPFRLNKYMSFNRFEQITTALRYTDTPAPAYVDKFSEVRDMIHSWNEHIKNIFIPSWMSCLDESMSSWTRRWTCPGFMYVPRKPHPMGNEYHSICCGVSGIMFGIELVEGKDTPPQVHKQFEEKGKTGGLLLRLCKGIFSTGKVVILDSGFCVLQAIIELKKKGVFASAMIKKRRYWPKNIAGEEIKQHMSTKAVGTCERLPGVLDGQHFDVFALKEPDYVLMMMSTYGSLIINDGQRDSIRMDKERRPITRFKYTEVIGNHFAYRGAVDDHNAKRHDCGTKNGLCLEDSWSTNRWENKVFAFILAITEVNAYLAIQFFTETKYKQLEFRKKLSYEMVHNRFDREEEEEESSRQRGRTRSRNTHQQITAPAFSNFVRGKWQKKYKTMYQQHQCMVPKCKKRIRTVCSCDQSFWMCTPCFAEHVIDESIENLLND